MINTKKFSTTEKRTKKSVFSDSFGVCFLLIFIILLIYSGEYLSNPNILPIKYIKVEGKLSRLSQTELKDTVENNIRGGFFHLYANEVRLALFAIPWVREVSIKRIWPDSLKVIVFEQEASARWGDSGLLNLSGEYFSPDVSSIPNDLPVLFGPVNSEVKLLETFKIIQDALQSLPFRLDVVSVTLNKRRSWSFNLSNGVKVVLGRYAFEDRFDRFIKFIPSFFPDQINDINSIDLRYSNGLSVFWKNKFSISSN